MGAIEDVFDDLDADVSEEEFREAVEAKVEQMGGLADEETAAMLVAHELDDVDVEGVADVEPGLDDIAFTAKVTDVGELREFERDDGRDGRVLNAEVADETGSVRITLWDKMAEEATEQLEPGDVIGVAGRPKEGYTGVEVHVDDVDDEVDETIDVRVGDTHDVDDLSLGMSGVNVRGQVLEADSVRTFERDDGSEGKVASLTIGDSTGRIRVTLWDDMADRVRKLDTGTPVEVVDGYVRERDGDLELHLNDRSSIAEIDESIEYVPDNTPIESIEIGQRVDIAGVVRTTDPKRTFDRDDGSEGQVRNVRIQDKTGDVRIALWDEKADVDLGPGDRVAIADVEIEDGWRDDLEASANWRSTVTVLGDAEAGSTVPSPAAGEGSGTSETAESGSGPNAGLDGFAGDGDEDSGDLDSSPSTSRSRSDPATAPSPEGAAGATAAETVEFTGTVVQAGDPVVLDDGERTLSVETDADVHLGQEVTVRGRRVEEGRVDADEVF